MRHAGVLGALALITIARPTSAQNAPQYVVVKGDTCPIVAQKVYGDAARYDLLHEANPQLGPMPHTLVPGQVLNTPKPAPPAKVTFIRKDVVAATPGAHPAKLNEDLERGHKVSTLADSSAELTFKDTTRLQLADHTLVVVLGGTSSHASSKQATPSDTTLMTGELRVHLGTLVGKPKPVSTPSANTDIGGESKLSVDDKNATRLAVYAGKSSIAAGGTKVNVQSGFGSKAELGKKPTPPRPLPAAPIWSTPLPPVVLALGNAEIAATYAPGQGGPKAEKYHLQLSRDAEFNDLIVDVRVGNDITQFEAKALGPGRYFARVSAIDADAFEGPYGSVANVGVVRMAASPASVGKQAALTIDSGPLGDLACGLDGATPSPVKAPIPYAPGHPHVVRCALVTAPNEGGEFAMDAKLGGPVAFADSASEAQLVSGMLEQEVQLTVRDAAGAPVRAARIATKAPPGVVVGPLAEIAPGVYKTLVRRPRAATGAVVFELSGVATHTIPFDAMDVGGTSGAARESRKRNEFAIWLGAHQAREPRVFGGAVSIEAMTISPFGRAILGVGLRGSFERYGFGDAHRGDAWTLGLPITFGLAAVRPVYLALAPQVVFARFENAEGHIVPRAPGFGAQLGIGLRLGGSSAYAMQLEGGYRLLREQTGGDVSLSGAYLALSGRFGL